MMRRSFVVGMGEVGRRLAAALEAAGVAVTPVTRDRGWEELRADSSSPVLLAVREEALGEVLGRLADSTPSRLVLVQNGWLHPLLDGFPGCSRGLIWFTAKGDFFCELRPSLFAGSLAAPLADRLRSGGLAAQVLPPGGFAAAEVEKMGFNCVVGLPLAVHGLSLGAYLETREAEARAVFAEAVQVLGRAAGVEPDPGWWPAVRRAVAPIGWVRSSAAKALEFRNGAVVRVATELGMAAPVNASLLARAG